MEPLKDVITIGDLKIERSIKPFPVLNVRYGLESKYYTVNDIKDPLLPKNLNKNITIHLVKKNGVKNLNKNHVYQLLKYYDQILNSHW